MLRTRPTEIARQKGSLHTDAYIPYARSPICHCLLRRARNVLQDMCRQRESSSGRGSVPKCSIYHCRRDKGHGPAPTKIPRPMFSPCKCLRVLDSSVPLRNQGIKGFIKKDVRGDVKRNVKWDVKREAVARLTTPSRLPSQLLSQQPLSAFFSSRPSCLPVAARLTDATHWRNERQSRLRNTRPLSLDRLLVLLPTSPLPSAPRK